MSKVAGVMSTVAACKAKKIKFLPIFSIGPTHHFLKGLEIRRQSRPQFPAVPDGPIKKAPLFCYTERDKRSLFKCKLFNHSISSKKTLPWTSQQ
jgi:hypothetical protein